MLQRYFEHCQERAALGIPPLPLDVAQTEALIQLLQQVSAENLAEQGQTLLTLLVQRVPTGVDQAARLKAQFLFQVALKNIHCPLISPVYACELLGTMQGGYNIQYLVELLDHATLAQAAAKALKSVILIFDAFNDVVAKAREANGMAQAVLQAWADAHWFLQRAPLPEVMTVTVFKVEGETNTDDLSPAADAWSRADIPLHALHMLKVRDPNALGVIAQLNSQGHPIAYVGDVVGTGSSRKSALNSLLWHIGQDIPYVPNKRAGGVILGGKIAPIFFNTAQDSGALPIECEVKELNTGDIITIYPYQGIIKNATGKVLATFQLRPVTLPDECQAGGRIPLIIGRALTDKAREALALPHSSVFRRPQAPEDSTRGFTLAQKIVGRACGVQGIRAGTYCEPRVSTVGSQDTTGAMTRDELKELACLGFSADFVLQSFCHTAAYPKSVDIKLQHELPAFMQTRGGVVLRPGDGIIHSWLNRMLLPDTVGTGGDSHTRFPIGISFPAGSGLVAFAAALGAIPLDMPESVLVRFKGTLQPGITLRDLVNAIPYVALQKGLLTIDKKGKKNVYSGRVMEIEGLPHLKVEQAFELADASAERSANGCTIKLDPAPIIEYLNSNIALLKWMITQGYQDVKTMQRRIQAMEHWLQNPQLLAADKDAQYAEVIDIDLNLITEPLLACPNDPDYIRPLSEVAGDKVDEVFIGSCMTNIGHYRAAAKILENVKGVPVRLWVVPPTRMDQQQLVEEGYYAVFGQAGARTEVPGCSLCMGNQARVKDGATVVSTSTRNFPNRMGKDANVYLASAELSAVTAKLGYIPSLAQYREEVQRLAPIGADIYRYLNFHQMAFYRGVAEDAKL